MTMLDIRAPEEVPRFLRAQAELKASEPANYGLWRHRNKDGEVILVEIFYQPIFYKGEIVRLILCTDVTQKKRAEERAAFLTEASMVLAESLDLKMTLNRVARLSVPFLADCVFVELYGERSEITNRAYAHYRPGWEAQIAALRKNHDPSRNLSDPAHLVLKTQRSLIYPTLEAEMILASQPSSEVAELTRLLAAKSAIFVPLIFRERVQGIMSFMMSDSGRRYGMDELRAAEDLARRASQAIENSKLYQQAQAAVEIRDSFVKSASQELRAPLTSLGLQIQLLQQWQEQKILNVSVAAPNREKLSAVPSPYDLEEELLMRNSQLTRILEISSFEVEKLGRTVKSLYDLAQIDSGLLVLHRTQTDLQAVLGRIAAKLNLTVRITPNWPVIGVWDRAQLEGAFLHLLSEISKNAKKKAILIRLQAESGKVDIRISMEKPDDYAISPFHAFGDSRRESRNRWEGYGLGLHIARIIIQMHGGSLEKLEGSDHQDKAGFRVTLPQI
jgi:signal transduction histidine kinase